VNVRCFEHEEGRSSTTPAQCLTTSSTSLVALTKVGQISKLIRNTASEIISLQEKGFCKDVVNH